MKSLAFIAILSGVFLSGCASYGYQRSYVGYDSGYTSGYGYSSSYPSSVYYRQSVVPGYSQHYSPPGYGHNHGGGRRYDWERSYGRHGDMQRLERRLDRQEHAIRRGVQSGELTRREADRLQRDTSRIDRNMDRVQRGSWVPEYRKQRLEQDLDRSQQRIRAFKNNDLTAESPRERRGGDGWRQEGRRR
jgi:hypothetical protein